MRTLLSIAKTKGFVLDSNATIYETMECMLTNGSGTTVLLENNKPIGIVTESLLIKTIALKRDITLPVRSVAKTALITIHKNAPVESAFDLIVSNNIRRLIMVDDAQEFCGVILQENLFNFLEEDVYKVDLKVKDLLSLDSKVVTASDSSSIQEASLLMYTKHIGSVIVRDRYDRAIGIITERDILSAEQKSIDVCENVQKLMSTPVLCVYETDAVIDVIEKMKRNNIRRVLVQNRENKMRTVLTNRDIFHHIKGNVAHMLEIKLRHAKEIMNLLPQAIIEIFDLNSTQKIHWMNQQGKLFFGIEFLEKSPEKLMGKEVWNSIYSQISKNGLIDKVLVSFNKKSFEFSGTISHNINNAYIKLIIQDITQHETIKQKLQNEIDQESQLRRENEYLMMQQSRMASMGEMVGHIAHQWRQPLAQLGGIFMNLESAYLFGDFNQGYLEKKVKQGNEMITYMSETIDDFRLFFSPQQSRQSFDLVFYLKHAINIVLASLNYHHIEVAIDGNEGDFFAVGSPNEFSQSILNILNNSRDALSKQQGIKRKIHIIFTQKSNSIMIRFCDNGGGIKDNILPNIFEPFVSGNLENGGSGAGLYITRLVIEQKMGGKIEAYNRVDGACFKILL
jgi:signal transduction histidine kinase/CBS domain-containing protein